MGIWKTSSQGVTEQEIQDVENQLGVCFPKDFIDIVRKPNAGRPTPKVIDVCGSGQVVRQLLSFLPGGQTYIVEETEDLRDDGLDEKIIPFANDPFGNYFCFDFRVSDSNPEIVFYDHETDPDEDDAFTFVSNSFTSFLSNMKDS